MFYNILTPDDQSFFNWNYTATECIEHLRQLTCSDDVDLHYLEEWVALSLETLSIEYYKNNHEAVAMLIEAIAAAMASIEPTRLSELSNHSFLLHNGLRALLSQSGLHPKPSSLIQLYRLLPVIPKGQNFDIHIMFQCFFGYGNVLNKWQENFENYAKDNDWTDYNALQLNTGRALIGGCLHKTHPLITQLDEEFKEYLLSTSDNPLAAEWFPWFFWFVRSKISPLLSNLNSSPS